MTGIYDLVFNPLSVNLTKWSNSLKQFFCSLLTNCLSVFDHFVGLTLERLIDFAFMASFYKINYIRCIQGKKFESLAKIFFPQVFVNCPIQFLHKICLEKMLQQLFLEVHFFVHPYRSNGCKTPRYGIGNVRHSHSHQTFGMYVEV